MDENDTLTKVDLIRCCMRTAKVSRKETILVGDSMFDAASAQEAGVAFLAVTYGLDFKIARNGKRKMCIWSRKQRRILYGRF